LATERGLSDNYQLSTRLSLEGFAHWLERRERVSVLGGSKVLQMEKDGEELPEPVVKLDKTNFQQITDYLAHKKRLGLSAASIKLIVVALKIFFRWLHIRKRMTTDLAEHLRCRESSATCRRR